MKATHPRSLTPDQLAVTRLAKLPADAALADAGTGDGSAVATWDNGRIFCAAAFRARAAKPLWIRYARTAQARDAQISDFKTEQQRNADSRAQQKKPHTLVPGQILFGSYGYEQTTPVFYQVTAVRGCRVDLRKLNTTTVTGDTWQRTVSPLADDFAGEPTITKRADGDNLVKVADCVHVSPWNNRPQHCSTYA